MKIALNAKNKLGFVDGTIRASMANTPALKQAWFRCNNMVSSWIMKCVSPQITASVIYRSSAFKVQNVLWKRFQQANGPRISQLQKKIGSISQEESSVVNYFTDLQVLWDQLLNHRPMPKNSCGNCMCGVNEKIDCLQHQDYIMPFLNGLSESHA